MQGEAEKIAGKCKACRTAKARATFEAAITRLFDEAAEVVREKGATDGQEVAAWLRAYTRPTP